MFDDSYIPLEYQLSDMFKKSDDINTQNKTLYHLNN